MLPSGCVRYIDIFRPERHFFVVEQKHSRVRSLWRFCKRVGCGVRAFNAEVSPNAYWLGSCCESSVLRDAFASVLSTHLLFAADAVK